MTTICTRRAHDEAEILQLVAVHDDHMHIVGLMAVLAFRLPGGDTAMHLGGNDRPEDRDLGYDKYDDLGRLVVCPVDHHRRDERIHCGIGCYLETASDRRIGENADVDRHRDRADREFRIFLDGDHADDVVAAAGGAAPKKHTDTEAVQGTAAHAVQRMVGNELRFRSFNDRHEQGLHRDDKDRFDHEHSAEHFVPDDHKRYVEAPDYDTCRIGSESKPGIFLEEISDDLSDSGESAVIETCGRKEELVGTCAAAYTK